MAIGLRLKELRRKAELTQKRLAELTGIPLQSLINYENGRRDPNSRAMVALEQYFGVSGAYLRGETDKPLHTYIEDWETQEDFKNCNVINICKTISTSAKKCNEFEQKMIFDILVELRHILNMENNQFGTSEADARAVTLGLLQKMIWYLNSYSDRIIATGIAKDFNRIDDIIADTVDSVQAALEKAALLKYPSSISAEEMVNQINADAKSNKIDTTANILSTKPSVT